jgi:repressor LexA
MTDSAIQPDPGHVLTWRQRKILRAIRESVRNRGYPPSMLELCEAVGLTSTGSVSYQLRMLQRKGYLHRDLGRARTMEVRLPGRLPGIDIPSQEAEGALFLHKVTGDPMINAAIADGDWIVVRQQDDAQHGEIIMAALDGEVTVKIFERGDEASILGRVVAVLRRV